MVEKVEKLDYDEYQRNLKPGDFGYSWTVQQLIVYDLNCAIQAVALHLELLKRELNIAEENRHWEIASREADRICQLGRL